MLFVNETIKAIKDIGKTVKDVTWVGSRDGEYSIPWEQFARENSDMDYYSGYGSAEMPLDIVVVFNDNSWLERREYDGSEWWEYARCPINQKDSKPFHLKKGMWSTIYECERGN